MTPVLSELGNDPARVAASVWLDLRVLGNPENEAVMQQIVRAFGRVESSFQYLVSGWTTIVELISVYKRLRAFEHRIGGAAANARPQGSSAN